MVLIIHCSPVLTRILSNDGERGGIMKQKYLLWFASVATVVMLIIALACNLTQFNDGNKSPKALLPANEMISDYLEEYTVEWYSKISSIMINNDDLLKKDVVQEYIIANSLSFQGIEHINIKVFGDETGEMTYKFYNSEFENEGEMNINKNISLTKKQVEQVVNIFEKNHFWDIPSRHPDEMLGLDGNTIFIEGININKYNIISMWCPDD